MEKKNKIEGDQTNQLVDTENDSVNQHPVQEFQVYFEQKAPATASAKMSSTRGEVRTPRSEVQTVGGPRYH